MSLNPNTIKCFRDDSAVWRDVLRPPPGTYNDTYTPPPPAAAVVLVASCVEIMFEHMRFGLYSVQYIDSTGSSECVYKIDKIGTENSMSM